MNQQYRCLIATILLCAAWPALTQEQSPSPSPSPSPDEALTADVAQPQVAAAPAASGTGLNDQDIAFLSAIAGIPGSELEPAEIRVLKETARDRMREEVPNDPPARAVSTVVSAGFGPAAAAPSITLYHGYVTTIDIVDSTGQPWPAYSPTIGDEASAKLLGEIAAAKTDSPTVLVQPVGRYSNTNLVLPLRGAPRPIAVLLRNDDPGAKSVVHDRITIIVDGRGPNAAVAPAVRFGGPEDDLRAVLLGEQPSSKATLAHVDMHNALAWRDGNQMWLRTTAQLVSPAPDAVLQLDGIRAYRATSLPAIVIQDDDGALRTVRITDTEIEP